MVRSMQILVVLAVMALALPLAAQRPPPPDLPDLPGTPVMSGMSFPDCRNDHRATNEPYERAAITTDCVEELDAYHAQVLAPFRERMIAHQEEISRIYNEEVKDDFRYTQEQADGFFARVTQEHEDSNPDGRHLETWQALNARYEADRAYLLERFCHYAGTCTDYTPPADVAERNAEDGEILTASRERSDASRRVNESGGCGTERTGGSVLGGLLGGIVGSAVGVDAIGSALVGAFAGTLVAEIACQLNEEEQELAAEATEEVTETAEVGATSEWTSPTREDVSGSSTVTALVSEPNGSSCLDITDVIIVEGEETRISKRMCRAPGESRYVLAA